MRPHRSLWALWAVWVLAIIISWWGEGSAHAEVILRIGTVAPEGSRYMKDMRLISDEVSRLSGGEVSLKWMNGGRLGDERAMAELLRAGKLDGGAFTGVGLSYLVDEMRLWSYPGMFQSFEEVDYIEAKYRDEFGGYFQRRGLILLSWADVGFAFVYSKEPISGLDDLRSHTLWLWSDDEAGIDAATLLNIPVHHTSLGVFVDRLRQNTIDAWIYPPLAAVGWGIHGHAHYMSELAWHFLSGALFVRKDVFDRLRPEHQQALLAIGRKWERRLVKSWRAENHKAVAAMKRQGTRVVRVSHAERQRFFQAVLTQAGAFGRRWSLESLMHRFADDLNQWRGRRR